MTQIAITVKQPFGYLICAGIKDVENRSWKLPEKYKGQRVLIHAGKRHFDVKLEIEGQATAKEIQMLSVLSYAEENDLFGCIIGSVEIVDCVENHPSEWAIKGQYHWVLANPILFDKPIENVKGKLGFWKYEVDLCPNCLQPAKCSNQYCSNCVDELQREEQDRRLQSKYSRNVRKLW